MDYNIDQFLRDLEIEPINPGMCTGTKWHITAGDLLTSMSPADGHEIASIRQATAEDYNKVVDIAQKAFPEWRKKPAPCAARLCAR
jgi:aldehyde dehydrogenase (NAD+)